MTLRGSPNPCPTLVIKEWATPLVGQSQNVTKSNMLSHSAILKFDRVVTRDPVSMMCKGLLYEYVTTWVGRYKMIRVRYESVAPCAVDTGI